VVKSSQKTNYITPGGFKRLQDEYNFYKKEERPRITKLVAWAASLGDRSENADYLYGKKRLREIDKRMRFLSSRIGSAQVVDPMEQRRLHEANQRNNQSRPIQFGATVTLEDGEGQERVISIVGVDESNVKEGRVSWQSPLGRSLLGKEVGDSVVVRAPGGENEYEIVEFIYKEIEIEEFHYDGPSESESR
jgi:transcription elongation factor GreB